MSVTLSPEAFSKNAQTQLLCAAPKMDAPIRELAEYIMQEKLPVQNTEIHYVRGKTDIRVRFSKDGQLTHFSRCDQGIIFNSNFKLDCPDLETPGPLAKYQWTRIDPPRKENVRPIRTDSDYVATAMLVGGVTLAALSCPPTAVAAVGIAASLVALPIIAVVGADITIAVVAPVAAVVMTAAAVVAAPIVAITTIAMAPLIVIGSLLSAL